MGRKLSGRYKIIGNVGNGGMANVYLAHDLILGRDVAIKVLRYDFRNDQTAIRRFQREALAATELVHPNIVSVYDVGEEDGMQYIVMEYVKGMDLKRYIREKFPMQNRRVVEIMEQVLSAISLAHEHQIIHRDLKPQNILVNEYGEVKITDFGIAIALSETSITQTNTLLGSVHYLSPEQARGSMATRQSDIYALGIILYELLTGKVPFEGESAVSIALKHFQENIPSVRDINPNVPQALENVVLRATTKEAADRYQSVEEMNSDIGTALSPSRMNELPFEPVTMADETKVLSPVPDTFSGFSTAQDAQQSASEVDALDEAAKTATVESTPKKKKKKRKWIIIVSLIIAFLFSMTMFLAMTAPKTVPIPDVVGMDVVEATTKLQAAKLVVNPEVIEINDEEVEEGLIVKTSPPVKTLVKEKAEITLYVSTGAAKVPMPDVTNMSYPDAVKALEKIGIEKNQISKVEREDEEVGKGKIVSQKPDIGEEIVAGNAEVKLIVSKGAPEIVLRDLVKSSESDARAYAEKNDFLLSVKYDYSATIPQGLIAVQMPSAGTKVKKGDSLTIFISLGPEPQVSSYSSQEPVETTPSSTSSSVSTTTTTSTSSSSSSSTTETTTDPSSSVNEPEEEGNQEEELNE